MTAVPNDADRALVERAKREVTYAYMPMTARRLIADMAARLEGIIEVGARLERARHKIGHVSIDAMEGDNLAVTLCSRFDDPEAEQDEHGWSEAAVAGCDETLAAIHAVYRAALTTSTGDAK